MYYDVLQVAVVVVLANFTRSRTFCSLFGVGSRSSVREGVALSASAARAQERAASVVSRRCDNVTVALVRIHVRPRWASLDGKQHARRAPTPVLRANTIPSVMSFILMRVHSAFNVQTLRDI